VKEFAVNHSANPQNAKVKLRRIGGALLLIILSLLSTGAEAREKRYIKGNPADINPPLAGPAYDLGGGGLDVDEAIQWTINQARGCTNCSSKVDVVVIRASGEDAYNQPIYDMNGVDSVETIIINSRQEANNSDIVARVKKAEVLFFAGGDQCKYIDYFKNTQLETAIKSVVARGGAIGGTSAGAMIQSSYVYNACGRAVESRDALEDPYRDIEFTYNFLPWANLKGTVIDTHFDKRDRMGRLMTFIARQIQDGKSRSVLGIGLSEETSVVVNRYGQAKVMGRGPAYFVLGDRKPEVCEQGRPLTFSNIRIWRIRSGGTFNLKNRPKAGSYIRNVNRGRIDSNPY
jgi:cyanophycinase